MTKRNDNDTQLEAGRAVALTNESKLSLYKKSQKSGIATDILEEVYRRGFLSWSEEVGGTPQQFAFDRVNSFVAGGYAAILDEDLKKACWKGYEAYGMKTKNGKKVPNCVPVKEAETEEKHSTNPDDPASRFVGSSELTGVYMNDTPGQIIKRVCKESAAWQRKEGKDPEGGLNRKGVESYRRENPGSKLQMAVTTPPSKLDPDSKAAKRRKSFCARMSGSKGPMKDEHGKPTRKALALRKWNCSEEAINEISDELKMKYTNKAMKQTREKEKKAGDHYKREEGIHRAARLTLRDKKKEVKEDVGAAATAAQAPTASGLRPTNKLGRNAPTEISTRGQSQGLNRTPGTNRYSNFSSSKLSGNRTMTSGSTSVTAKTLTPQRASVSQPTPKTASSAPTSKPSASFGSSSRPTTVRATAGSLEKSGGYKLSSGMSDAGKVKVRPEAPAEVLGGVARKGLGAALRAAGKSTVAGIAMNAAAEKLSDKAQASYKAGHQSFTPHGAEGEKASTVFNRMRNKSQGRSISTYEKDVLTPKASAPKPVENPKVDAPLPPTRPDHFTRGQAFKDARSQAGGGEGKFTYNNKSYQTNVKGEKYKPASTLKPTNVND